MFRPTFVTADLPWPMVTAPNSFYPVQATDQQIFDLRSITVIPDAGAPSGHVILVDLYLTSASDSNWFAFPYARFDAVSGAYLGYIERWPENGHDILYDANTKSTQYQPGGELIVQHVFSVYRVTDRSRFDSQLWFGNGYWLDEDSNPNTTIFREMIIDTRSGLAVISINNTSQGRLNVHRISDGTLQRQVRMAGFRDAVMAQSRGIGLAVDDTGTVSQYNYENGETYTVTGMPEVIPGEDIADRRYTLDQFYHRILVTEMLPGDGLSSWTFRVRGYDPQPITTELQQPIMATGRPRVGEQRTVFTRAIGNAGEVIGGVPIDVSSTGNGGTVRPSRVITDENGYGLFYLDGDAEDTEDVTVSTDNGL